MSEKPISFIDLKAQRDRIRGELDAAIARVLDHGAFIMGKEVGEFEARLAEFTGAKHAVSCANGTDALQLALMIEGIGPGDAVFVPAFTFVATAEIVSLLGAVPVFVDVRHDTFNLEVESLDDAVNMAMKEGLRPRAVIPVDLFGQPADYAAINAIAQRRGLVVIADAAQAIGGALNGKRVGTLATTTTASFFPAKPLGCYGDGGAVLTDDDDRAALLKSLRIHGKGTDKYDNVRVGLNSRLDTLQAAVLKEKLAIFDDELARRDRIAQRYSKAFDGLIAVPFVIEGGFSAWAQYTVKLDDRDTVMATLKGAGIPSMIYYPIPMNKQTGYRNCPIAPGGVPVSEALAKQVLSLPMHPYLDDETQEKIINVVRTAVTLPVA